MSDQKKKQLQEEVLKLFAKAEVEQRALDKENSFHLAKTGKRDIIVHLQVTVLPEVNERVVVGERMKECEQLCFRIPARMVPARRQVWEKAFRELMTFGFKQVISIGGLRE